MVLNLMNEHFQRFIKDNKETVSKVLKRTVKLAEEKGFTKFNHILSMEI